ncbi:MAG: sec-independent protein translocase protein TatB [Micromonosporaceae bacterium]
MFGLENLDGWKLLVLLLLGIFIFGPDKLPKAIADGVRMLRNVRDMARNATSDLSRELGTDIQLEDLNPKALIRKHLLSEEDEQTLRKPLEDLYHDVQADVKGLGAEISDTAAALDHRTPTSEPAPVEARPKIRHAVDADAT